VPGSRASRRFWRPPAETLEALGQVLGAHWRAVARRPAARLFSARSVSWLSGTGAGEGSLPGHHFTTGGKLIK
jgi:hypothetical protein